MATVTQPRPIFVQYGTSGFPQEAQPLVGAMGYFLHPVGTNTLYMTENDGQIRYRSITGVETGTNPYAPVNPTIFQGFYHPLGSNRLYLREGAEGEWIDIGGVIAGDSLNPPFPTPYYDGNLYHPIGTNKLFFLENDNGTLRWVNIAGVQPGINNNIEYYVNAVVGNDVTGDGSASNPFQTLQYAYSLLPHSPAGSCRIMLQGEGPYILPSLSDTVGSLQAFAPQGILGEPTMICGDTMFAVFVGTVTFVNGATIQFGGTIFENEWRGLIYHGLSGASAGYFYQIAHNDATTVFSIGNTFSAGVGDNFEILRPVTRLTAVSDCTINGPGKLGFWRCRIECEKMNIIGASVLFDACTVSASNRFSGLAESSCQFMATVESDDFKFVTIVGTRLGKVGLFIDSLEIDPNGARMFDGASGTGYLITRCGIDTWTTGRWIFMGTDIDLSGGVGPTIGIVCQSGGYLEMDQGYHNLKMGGAGGTGIIVTQGASARLTAADIRINHAGVAAIIVSGGGVLGMDNVQGDIDNGYGVWVREGGFLTNYGNNTVEGIAGDVLIDPSPTALDWNVLGPSAFGYTLGSRIRRTPIADSNYTANANDELIAYTSLTAVRSVSLPAPATMNATSALVKRMTVKDESGNASPILTILINGTPGVGFNSVENAYGSRSFYTDGTTWYFDGSPDAP